MRSTVTLDESILRQLLQLTEAKTKSQAVLFALQDFIRRKKLLKIKTLKGKIHFDLTADEMRHHER